MKLDHDTQHAVNTAVALVNSHNVMAGRDDLQAPEDLRRIVAANGYAKSQPISSAVLEEVRLVRDRLRQVFTMQEEDAVATLDEMVASAEALPRLVRHNGSDWHFHFTETTTGWAPTLAADLAMGLLFVIRDWGHDRLGVCASPTCADAFVDLSRNASKRYCDPRTCGNRAAVQAYRARQND